MTPERPRDALGRPLPFDADPTVISESVADVTPLTDAQVWATAMAYLDRDMPFHAHEVFEQRWRTAAPADRPVWKALAQWGAALTHAARGNVEGARRLAARARDGLAEMNVAPDGVDAERVRASCERLANDRLASG